MTSTPENGFSLLELLVVTAIFAAAAAVAVPILSAAGRATDVAAAETELKTSLQAAITRAAVRGEATSFHASELRRTSTVAVNPDGVAPPDGSALADIIVFQAGTGYPTVGGARRPVAVVVVDSSDTSHAFAAVVGSAATLRVFRLGSGGWEEVR